MSRPLVRAVPLLPIAAILLFAAPPAAPAMQSGRINEIGRRHFGPPPSSPGPHTVLAPPQLRERETGGRTVALAADAIAARESYVVAAARMATDRPIALAAPALALPAGTIVVARTGAPDQTRCLVTQATLGGTPGPQYDDACLVDRDGDGRFETLHFIAEDKNVPARDAAIAPVGLERLPAAPDPNLTWFLVQRRLRVERIDGGWATLVVESRIDPGGEGGLGWMAIPTPDLIGRIRLRDGETARVAGLGLTIHGAGGGWQLAVAGEFAPWLVLRDHDTMVDTGEGTMQAD